MNRFFFVAYDFHSQGLLFLKKENLLVKEGVCVCYIYWVRIGMRSVPVCYEIFSIFSNQTVRGGGIIYLHRFSVRYTLFGKNILKAWYSK